MKFGKIISGSILSSIYMLRSISAEDGSSGLEGPLRNALVEAVEQKSKDIVDETNRVKDSMLGGKGGSSGEDVTEE